jgi:3',5'-cyclic AMP phosphodiesterase CpdA
MYKLAHISDIHLGPLPEIPLRDLFSKRITGYLNWQRNRRKHLFGNTLETVTEHIRSLAPDHLAVTGDLVNLATRIEIQNAALWLQALGTGTDISVVPGNHDAYVPGASGRASRAWAPYLTGDNDVPAAEQHYPYLRRRGPIALIGCSTAVATPPFSANGYFSPRQARETRKLLMETGEQGYCRVVMIHHPPIVGATSNHKRMVGIRRFGEVMREAGAELVLHGHTHLNTLYSLKGKDRDVPVVGIASASQSPGGRKPPASWNMFSIDGEAGAWNITRQRYTLADNAMDLRLDVTETL